MADKIILKNKKLTIKVDFHDNSVSTFKNLTIIRGGIDTEIYEEEDGGVVKLKGSSKAIDGTLTEFALREKRAFYKHLFQTQYKEIENIVVLSGAGSSVGIGSENKGLTMAGLWDALYKEHPDCLTTLVKDAVYHSLTEDGKINEQGLIKDLEALLSKSGMMAIVSEMPSLNEAIIKARKFISEKCNLILPELSPHLNFLNKILLRPNKFPRVKIFTLNYDTLIEQAAAREKFTVIDGFTFSSPRVFNGKYFDYDIVETRHNRQDKKDNSIAKLFYLFKMHGSLNWRRNNKEIEQFDGEIDVNDRIMIFPQDNKYEHSYEQPYFEMMARFQQALRTDNTLLITIGFSFLDKHISSVVLESIKQNPSLSLIAYTYPEIVDFSSRAKSFQKELHLITEMQSRVTLVAETFEDLANEYPENIAHKRYDMLEDLNENLKQLVSNEFH